MMLLPAVVMVVGVTIFSRRKVMFFLFLFFMGIAILLVAEGPMKTFMGSIIGSGERCGDMVPAVCHSFRSILWGHFGFS
jgi:dipeptide/tripeptide permease